MAKINLLDAQQLLDEHEEDTTVLYTEIEDDYTFEFLEKDNDPFPNYEFDDDPFVYNPWDYL